MISTTQKIASGIGALSVAVLCALFLGVPSQCDRNGPWDFAWTDGAFFVCSHRASLVAIYGGLLVVAIVVAFKAGRRVGS